MFCKLRLKRCNGDVSHYIETRPDERLLNRLKSGLASQGFSKRMSFSSQAQRYYRPVESTICRPFNTKSGLLIALDKPAIVKKPQVKVEFWRLVVESELLKLLNIGRRLWRILKRFQQFLCIGRVWLHSSQTNVKEPQG